VPEKQSSNGTCSCKKLTYLGAAKITSKTSDMTKVAIKNDNITFFGGIYHIMDVFSKLGLEKTY
jgi:conserved domain protein (fragment)